MEISLISIEEYLPVGKKNLPMNSIVKEKDSTYFHSKTIGDIMEKESDCRLWALKDSLLMEYQYSAAWDSKHKVTLEDGKSARVLFELQQMTDGGVSI